MEKKDKRPVYEPPRSTDLSAYSASGLGPMGICAAGPSPFDDCQIGLTFDPGPCGPGSGVSGCFGGAMPEQVSCRDGSNALVGCIAGGDA